MVERKHAYQHRLRELRRERGEAEPLTDQHKALIRTIAEVVVDEHIAEQEVAQAKPQAKRLKKPK